MPLPIGPLELVLVLGIALLILGPGKLPEVGSALGRTIREFRKASTDIQEATDLSAEPSASARRSGGGTVVTAGPSTASSEQEPPTTSPSAAAPSTARDDA